MNKVDAYFVGYFDGSHLKYKQLCDLGTMLKRVDLKIIECRLKFTDISNDINTENICGIDKVL